MTDSGAVGVNALEGADDTLVDGGVKKNSTPAAFVAVTVHVYTSPSVRPVTTIGLAASDARPGRTAIR